MAEWRFPSNDHGETKGINDSGVAQFRGTPLRSLAREICQNSLDAARQKTVTVEFNAFQIPVTQLPGSDELRDTFARCIEFWGAQRAVTTKQFFSNAYEKISADTVHVLRISDFCTSGLTGSHAEVNTHWTNLTKSSGVSDKSSTSGGSFGIGKFAPFACSDFSTVFYSTYDEEKCEASQGVARLVTFRRPDGETTHGVGFFGEQRNTPTFAQLRLEPGFSRDKGQHGTDIYIVGYKYANAEDGWEKSIILSILDSFLGAIWDEKLIVKVGAYEIKKDTLNEIIEMFRDELMGNTERYYEVLTSEKTKWFEENNFLGLGKIKLGLLLGGQEMPRKVAMIRKTGMKIKEQDHISSFIPFAGIMFIEGESINARLRQLENPEHTEWQVARADNEAQAKALLRSIRDYLCKKVEELASEGGQDDFEDPSLGNLISDVPDDANQVSKEEGVTDRALVVEKRVPKKKKAHTSGGNTGGVEETDLMEDGYVEGDSILGYIHNGHTGKKRGEKDPYLVDPNPDEKGNAAKPRSIIPQKLRIICIDKRAGKYMIMFIPSADTEHGAIRLNLSAEAGSYLAPVVEASVMGQGKVEIKDGLLKGIAMKKDMPLRITVTVDYTDYCSMEVSAYAN